MALAFSAPKPIVSVSSLLNGRRCAQWTLTVGAYVTDGLALAPATVGMTEIDVVIPIRGCKGFAFDYDRTNDKLLVYTSGGTQVGNAVDPGINAAQVWIIGS